MQHYLDRDAGQIHRNESATPDGEADDAASPGPNNDGCRFWERQDDYEERTEHMASNPISWTKLVVGTN